MPHKIIDARKPYKAYNTLAEKLENTDEFGYIIVRVITELGKVPLKDVKISVYASLNELVKIETVTTDEMGNAPLIKLPVAYNPQNLQMSPTYYYTDYNIVAQLENYYTVAIYDIQIFPDITTRFDINMTKVPVETPYPRKERTIIIPRINL